MAQFGKLHALLARAWTDLAYKRRLLTEPAAVLAEAGIAVPRGVELQAVDTETTSPAQAIERQ